MSKKFDSVLASKLGGFVRSPLGVRETTISGEFGYLLRRGPLPEMVFASRRYDSGADSWSVRRADTVVAGETSGVFAASPSGDEVRGYRTGGFSQRVLPQGKGLAEYNPVTDSWVRKHDMVHSRSGGASAATGNKGFSVTGWAADRPGLEFIAIKDAEVYFATIDLWVNRTDWSLGKVYPDAIGSRGKYYVTGGGTPGTGEQSGIPTGASGAHFNYDDDTRAWSRMIFMPVRRYSHIALAPFAQDASDEFEYAIRGADGTSWSRPTNSVMRADLLADTWTDVQAHPERGFAGSGFALSDGLYTAEGIIDIGGIATNRTFRFTHDTWIARASVLEGPHFGQFISEGTKL